MESQPQNPEFRNNPENFHPCYKHFKMAPVWANLNMDTWLKVQNFPNPKY